MKALLQLKIATRNRYELPELILFKLLVGTEMTINAPMQF